MLLLSLVVLASGCNTGQQKITAMSDVDKVYPDHQKIFLLPVNVALPKGQRLNIKVAVPRDFTTAMQQTSADGCFMEFVPNGENLNKWTQLMVVMALIGKRATVSDLQAYTKDGILSDSAERANVICDEVLNLDGYTAATLIIIYKYHNHSEAIISRIYAGKYDLVQLQLSVAVKPNESADEVVKRLREFLDKNTEVVRF